MLEIFSRNVAGAEYDQDTEDLTITFQSGGVYVYKAVPPHVYGQFIQSIDPGGFFNAYIKASFEYDRTN